MDIKNFQIATWAYIQNFVKPNLTNDLDRWVMYFGLGFGTLAFQKKINEYMPFAKQVGILNQNNEIDLCQLQKYGKFAFQKQPKIKIWKLTFCQQDFDEFIGCLKKGDISPIKSEIKQQSNIA